MRRIEKTVFLSYRRTDMFPALLIYNHLTHQGFDVFFDYQGIGSGDFESVILENIRARAHFLVLLTPKALERCTDANDWLRREIEESISYQRNIVPLFLEGFDFRTPAIAAHLTGKLTALGHYNGMGVPAEYFDAAMAKLCNKFLNVPLEAVLHPASNVAQVAARQQQVAASTDVLTGLLHRREFEIRVEQALRSTKDDGARHAICFLDFDQFKIVNETYGHLAGDALLKKVAGLIQSEICQCDALGRLGGDEFGLLIENVTLDDAVQTAELLRESVRSFKFMWGERTLRLSVSIGVVPISADSVDVGSVLSACENA